MSCIGSLVLELIFLAHVLAASFDPSDHDMAHLVHHAQGLHAEFFIVHAIVLI